MIPISTSARLRLYANQLLENGDVHFIDLSSDPDRFLGLKPECLTYGTESSFESFLLHIRNDFEKRHEIYQQAKSLDHMRSVSIVVAYLPNNSLKATMEHTVRYFLGRDYRVLKYSFILHELDM